MTEQAEITIFKDKSYVSFSEYLKLKEGIEQLKQNLDKRENEFKYFSNSFKLKIQKLKDDNTELQEQVSLLEKKMELMKCRQNCKYGFEEKCKHRRCDPCSEWELKEEK